MTRSVQQSKRVHYYKPTSSSLQRRDQTWTITDCETAQEFCHDSKNNVSELI